MIDQNSERVVSATTDRCGMDAQLLDSWRCCKGDISLSLCTPACGLKIDANTSQAKKKKKTPQKKKKDTRSALF
jgi:hypothetical protein